MSLPLAVLFATFFYYVALIMLLTVIVIDLLERQCHQSYGAPCSALDDDQQDDASSQASLIISLSTALPNVFSLFTASLLGAHSDTVGRKPALHLTITCSMVAAVGALVVSGLALSVWLIVPFFLVSGLGGSLGAFNAAAFALVADTVPLAKRGRTFSLLEAALFLGCCVGPLVGGFLFDAHGAVWCYLLALGLFCICNFCVFMCPSQSPCPSLQNLISQQQGPSAPSQEAAPRAAEGSWLHTLLRPAKILMKNPALHLPAAVFLLLYWAINGNLFPQYAKQHKFDCSSSEVGYLYAVKYVSYGACLMFLLPALLAKGCTQVTAIRVGAVFTIVVLCAYGLATSKEQLWAIVVLEGGAAMLLPSIRTIISVCTERSEQGASLSIIANLETLVQLCAPIVMGQVWSAIVDWYSSLMYFMLASLAVLGLLLSMKLRVTVAKQGEPTLHTLVKEKADAEQRMGAQYGEEGRETNECSEVFYEGDDTSPAFSPAPGHQ